MAFNLAGGLQANNSYVVTTPKQQKGHQEFTSSNYTNKGEIYKKLITITFHAY